MYLDLDILQHHNWLVVWKKNLFSNIFNHIWDVILPIDFHIFQDG